MSQPLTRWEKRLARALEGVDRPASYCVEGKLGGVSPGLFVHGVGHVGLPVSAEVAESLKRACVQAPYGKGDKTLVDTKVRRVWKLGADKFETRNAEWGAALAAAVARVGETLGLEGRELKAHAYDLLLYEAGGFFLAHRDTEKLAGMVATLVVVLPSVFAGGQLVVRHGREERVIDFASETAPFESRFAAFYADCEHEVKPLESGHRICLVYNLTVSGDAPCAPDYDGVIGELSGALSEWPEGGPEKLAVALDHQYTEAGLSWPRLKGADAAKAAALAAAAARVGFEARLASIQHQVVGAIDDWGHSDKIIEVIEESLTASGWSSPDGKADAIGSVDVGEDEIIPRAWKRGLKADVHRSGYTGNEGATLDKAYRRAAIVLWPMGRRWQVRAAAGIESSLPALAAMAAKAGDDPARLDDCRAFLREILLRWPDARSSWLRPSKADPIEWVVKWGDAALSEVYLRGALANDASLAKGAGVAALIRRDGSARLAPALSQVFDATDATLARRNAGLIGAVIGADRSAEHAERCAGWLGAMIDRHLAPVDRESLRTWRSIERDTSDTPLSALLISAGAKLGAAGMVARVVGHVAANRGLFPLESYAVPAILAAWPAVSRYGVVAGAWADWVSAVRSELDARSSVEPTPPTDMRRDADLSCRCPACQALAEFLADPIASTAKWPLSKEKRQHVEGQAHQCDVRFSVEKKGSPHLLVGVKSRQSFEKRHQDWGRDRKWVDALTPMTVAGVDERRRKSSR